MKITVRTKHQNYTVACNEGERILYAALRSGAPLPYECATGTCGTCKARARPGDVRSHWQSAPGSSYLKPERGEFLMCQSTAHADCEILVPGKPAAEVAGGLLPEYLKGALCDLRMLTHDVAAFDVKLDGTMAFRAGQFVAVRTAGLEGYRAYSMVNHDERTDRLSFVVKRLPGGGFSNWLFDGSPQNQPLEVFGPLGRATYDPSEGKDILCIAGGSGIAGIMSILAHSTRAGHFEQHRGRVFFGVRGMRDVFFHEELSDFVTRAGGNLEVTIALSDEEVPASAQSDYPRLGFATGMVHLVTSERMSDQYGDAVAFVAGPPPMVDGTLRVLIVEGRLPASSIRYDKFG